MIEKMGCGYCLLPRDDETTKGFIDLQKACLERLGNQVKVVLDLDEITQKEFVQYDCVLAHPRLDQIRGLIELHQSCPGVALIITTGSVEGEDELHALSQDSQGIYFLPKPYGPHGLEKAVKKVTSLVKRGAKKH